MCHISFCQHCTLFYVSCQIVVAPTLQVNNPGCHLLRLYVRAAGMWIFQAASLEPNEVSFGPASSKRSLHRRMVDILKKNRSILPAVRVFCEPIGEYTSCRSRPHNNRVVVTCNAQDADTGTINGQTISWSKKLAKTRIPCPQEPCRSDLLSCVRW